MERYHDKEKNTKRRAKALAKIYIDKVRRKGYFTCSRLPALACDGQFCTGCDFNAKEMEENYNRVMKIRVPAKIDKTYKLTLKKIRGYNG